MFIDNKQEVFPQLTQGSIRGMAKGLHQYGEHSKPQKVAYEILYTYISKAIAELSDDPDIEAVYVADFGVSDCMNSYEIYFKIIESLGGKNITVCVNDLTTNDWVTAEKVCSKVGVPVVKNGDIHHAGSKIVLVPGSFFEQRLPSNSINISFTNVATHWLSSMDGLRFRGATSDQSQPDRINKDDLRKMQQRSYEDGVRFLVARGRELVDGGILLMGNCITVQGQADTTLNTVMDDVLDRWVEDGRLTREEVDDLTIPWYCKDAEEWTKCFEDEAVKEVGLKLEEMKREKILNPDFKKLKEQKKEGGNDRDDLSKFAKGLTKWMLAYAEQVLLKVFGTAEALKEYVDDVARCFVEQPRLCESCEVAFEQVYYVARKIQS